MTIYRFSARSEQRLASCHPDLQRLMREVIRHQDCSIIEGYRGIREQDQLFAEGKSKLRGGESKHNLSPSRAVDVAPYPLDWDNRDRWLLFVGRVRGIADSLGIRIRCGADWDGDGDTRDQSFHDLPHIELED